jgi:hypothetical protein
MIATQASLSQLGGEGGIRTHGTVSGTTVFKTVTFNHSVTSPLLFKLLNLPHAFGFFGIDTCVR